MASDQAEEGGLGERPLGELVKELAELGSTLVRREIALAKVEMREKGNAAQTAAVMLGSAGVLACLAAGGLTLALVAALATAIALWLAALIVAGAYLAAAVALGLTGRQRLRSSTPPMPEQTIETVKEDIEWLMTRKRSEPR